MLLILGLLGGCTLGSADKPPATDWRQIGRGETPLAKWRVSFATSPERGECYALALSPPPSNSYDQRTPTWRGRSAACILDQRTLPHADEIMIVDSNQSDPVGDYSYVLAVLPDGAHYATAAMANGTKVRAKAHRGIAVFLYDRSEHVAELSATSADGTVSCEVTTDNGLLDCA